MCPRPTSRSIWTKTPKIPKGGARGQSPCASPREPGSAQSLRSRPVLTGPSSIIRAGQHPLAPRSPHAPAPLPFQHATAVQPVLPLSPRWTRLPGSQSTCPGPALPCPSHTVPFCEMSPSVSWVTHGTRTKRTGHMGWTEPAPCHCGSLGAGQQMLPPPSQGSLLVTSSSPSQPLQVCGGTGAPSPTHTPLSHLHGPEGPCRSPKSSP